MKSRHTILSPRALMYGGICGGFCFISRTFFESPLEMVHLTESVNLLPPIWIFNLLSVVACFVMGMSAGCVIDYVVTGQNSGAKATSAYRGALYLSFSFFLFLVWFPILFFAQKLFMSFAISVIALICSVTCAFEWSRLRPSSASVLIYIDAVWLFYMMFVSLSIWWGS